MKTNLVFKTLPRTNCSSVRQWEAILGNLATAPLRHYLLATGQLKVMAMQLLLPSLGQFPRWFVKWLELVTRTSQVESWVKGGYLGRLAYQDNSTFQSFIRPFVDFSRNALCTEHCLRGRLCQSVALQKVLARRKRLGTEQPITDYLSPSVMPPLPSQANMDSSCFARLAWSTKLQHFEERERKSTFSQHNLTKWEKKELCICKFYCAKIVWCAIGFSNP